MSLVNTAIQIAPSVITLLRSLFEQQHPGAPPPTDAEVIAAFEKAFKSSLAKDNAWLASHPE